MPMQVFNSINNYICLTAITLILTLGAQNHCIAASEQNKQIRVIPHYDVQVYDQQIQTIYTTTLHNDKDLTSRINKVSQYFLGKPYLLYPLGEGPTAEFDKAPLYRTDGFDCQTYVETVLALANATNTEEFKRYINMIRYQHPKKITFLSRNHFTDLDWNTVNQRHGLIKDVTTDLGVTTQIAQAMIDKPAWLEKLSPERIQLFSMPTHTQENHLLQKLHAQSKQTIAQPSALIYVPLTALFDSKGQEIIANQRAFAKIPNGAIIEIVRPNWDLTRAIGTHLNVSHLGFAIRTPSGLMYRQASSEEQKVTDTPLVDYLMRYYQAAPNSSVKGISIQVPV